MRCPCCDHSIPDEMIVRAAASINGKKAVTGGKREGAGRPRKEDFMRPIVHPPAPAPRIENFIAAKYITPKYRRPK